ncbi:MAG TPA: sulfatase-like hydrolase/transferase [Kofleriaceae bacterium]|nr:sulfatase-like hydrolase/transferase [Kofleriaceae bacterium]
MSPSFRTLGAAARADVGGAIAAAAGGAIAFAAVEYVLTQVAYAGAVSLPARLELAALTATLSLFLWLALAVGVSAAALAIRGVTRSRAAGWLAAPPAITAPAIRPGAPRLWAVLVTGLASIAVLQRVAAWAILHFKEPQLTAALIAVIAVGWLAVAVGLARALTAGLAAGARKLVRLGPYNPLGRWRAAGVVVAGLIAAALAITWRLVPQSRSVMPVRLVVSGVVIGLGMGLGVLRRRRHPASAARSRRRALAGAGGALALIVATLVWLGAAVEPKYVAITASPALAKLIDGVRFANDLDHDGFGSLLGEGDCAPLDPRIHPGAVDVPDNGVDENCDGHDFSLRAAQRPAPGGDKQVPAAFQKDWNVLLITVDTLRYDHTTFGGYAAGPRHRDTTPNLADLVKRSVSFTFTNAPSAGTMASIPAILTSKFFHSGIALDEKRPPGMPPILLPENTTLPEIMKRHGYATGVVASHVYWNHWGLDQGVDDYDNSIGKTDDPFRVAADQVTDHALAWVSRQQGKRWFLWAHYIDPHGRYVAHPDVVDYGSSEPDLYDAEIKWTDQELGRLFRELSRLPSYEHTIIVLTSDHGDSMAEHGVPLGTHGTALYRELQHVPMIFYIPGNRPRLVGGAVSNLDIVPTLAQLCGIDVHDLAFEGKSLVPQLFYDGTEDHDRIVFAETNAPTKQRAAISEHWKLIYYFATNLYELYDLARDPWEHSNVATSQPAALATMKQALEAWMDRVMYARDPKFNQAFRQMSDVMLAAPPAPGVTTTGVAFGGLDVLGLDVADGKPVEPGAKLDVHVYFRVRAPSAEPIKFQLEVWPTDAPDPQPTAAPDPTKILRTGLRPTADGAFSAERWKPGDFIRERFPITVPRDWHAARLAVGLGAATAAAQIPPSGPARADAPSVAVLGTLVFSAVTPGSGSGSGSSASRAP